MTRVYRPGNLIIDTESTFSAGHAGSAGAIWPDGSRWEASVSTWLDTVGTSRVGSTLLRHLSLRGTGPAASSDARVVRMPANISEVGYAQTDSLPADAAASPPTRQTVYLSITPADAIGRVPSLDPMRSPAPVLVHELLHVLMGLHGVNTLLETDGSRRPIASWLDEAGAYPSFNEFLATTVQNMYLAERGLVLADGYRGDDPEITNWRLVSETLPSRPIGHVAARPGVDAGSFARRYTVPLGYLRQALPAFVAELAAMDGLPFNPFRTVHSGTSPRRTGAAAAPVTLPRRI